LLMGVRVRVKAAGWPLTTVAAEEEVPPTVRVKVPLMRPVPLRGIRSGDVEAELVAVMVPLRAPIADGVKVTVTAQLAPGARVLKVQGTVMAKSPCDVAKARLLMGALPVLLRVKVRMAEAPTAMLPKLRVAGVIWR
jgi:hypothetical protein